MAAVTIFEAARFVQQTSNAAAWPIRHFRPEIERPINERAGGEMLEVAE
jgi:hypothetical protein